MQNILKSKLFISAVLAVAAIATAVVIGVSASHSGSDLQAQLDLGEKYISELDYENAVIAYEEALEIDPYCLDAYLGLSDAYMALGQQDKAIEIMEQAKAMLPDSVEVYVSLAQLYASQERIDLVVSTLEAGILATNSDRLRELLREYQPGEEAPVQVAESSQEEASEEEQPSQTHEDEEEEAPSLAIGLEQKDQNDLPSLSIIQEEPVNIPLIAPAPTAEPLPPVPTDNVESESSGENGSGSEGGSSDEENSNNGGNGGDDINSGEDSDNNENIEITTGLKGTVKDIYGVPLPNFSISVKPLGGSENSTEATTVTDADGNYQLALAPGKSYGATFDGPGYQELYDETIYIKDGEISYYNALLLETDETGESASVVVNIIDAVSAQAVNHANVTVYEGFLIFEHFGSPVAMGETNEEGRIELEVPHSGYYTVTIERDGYTKTYYRAQVARHGCLIKSTMSPLLESENQYRIVLSWGEKPSILDSHFFGEDSDGSPYHICWYRWINTSGTVSLDVDHMGGYGPETITANIDVTKDHQYIVHNYSGGGDMVLSESGAQVLVYGKEGLVYSASVPNMPGRTWHVFNIVNGVIEPVNVIDFSTDSIYPPDGYGDLNYADHVYVNGNKYKMHNVDEYNREIVEEFSEDEDKEEKEEAEKILLEDQMETFIKIEGESGTELPEELPEEDASENDKKDETGLPEDSPKEDAFENDETNGTDQPEEDASDDEKENEADQPEEDVSDDGKENEADQPEEGASDNGKEDDEDLPLEDQEDASVENGGNETDTSEENQDENTPEDEENNVSGLPEESSGEDCSGENVDSEAILPEIKENEEESDAEEQSDAGMDSLETKQL